MLLDRVRKASIIRTVGMQFVIRFITPCVAQTGTPLWLHRLGAQTRHIASRDGRERSAWRS